MYLKMISFVSIFYFFLLVIKQSWELYKIIKKYESATSKQ